MAKLSRRRVKVPENLPALSNQLAVNPSSDRPNLSAWRRLVFAASSVLGILALLELALWACGVQPASARRDPFAGFTPQVSHFQVQVDATGQGIVTLVPNTSSSRSTTSAFLSTSRQIRSGSSAWGAQPLTAGRSLTTRRFPDGSARSCPRPIPPGKWEVINAGAISYASYRIKGLMAELSRFEPDRFIVCTGENEFLECRTYASAFHTPELRA